jgi:hypothetical protein
MSRYRKSMSELLNQVRGINKNEAVDDHEISMARGELEAIADKATQLASMLQSKSDEGNPLEAWVQSKITKAKDYITSVADYLTYNPDMKQNEELEESIMSNIAILKSEFQRLDTDYKKMKDEYNAIMAGSYKGDESAVEKKMFKALRSLKDVRQELTSALKTVKEEVEEIDEMEDYGLKGTITDKQLQNIKSVWAKKTKKDVTPGVKTMLAKLDTPTKIAIKQANINVLSDLVEEINEGFSSTLKAKAKEIAKKLAGNMTKAYDEIEKIAKGLSNDPEVQKALQMANEEVDRPKPSEPNPKELEEVISHTVRYTDPLNKKRFAIPYKTHADAEKKMAQLKKDGVKDINITMDALKPSIKFKEQSAYKNLTTFTEKYLKKNNVEEGLMKDIFTMDKAGASADDIAKRLKINVNTVKNILGEQKEELPVKKDEKKESDNKQNEIATKDKEIETLKGQVNLLKQKLENEKNKAVKPEPNPKTGEVPLTIGIAHAEFKKQEDKKKEIKEETLEEGTKPTDFKVKMKTPSGMKMVKVTVPVKDYKVDMASIEDAARKKVKGDMIDFDFVGDLKMGESLEEVTQKEIDEFTTPMIKDLQKSYADLKDKKLSTDQANALSKHLDRLDITQLKQLIQANIPFISTVARNKVYKKTGKFEEKRLYVESITGLKNKAEKSGMPYSILKQVYDRGMAAWKSGHRPGASQQQWAFARVNSFITKSSGTWGGADKDLAAKVKGSK